MLKIGDKVTIKSITKEGVRRQSFIYPLDTPLTIIKITDKYIVLKTGDIENIYYKGEVVFNKLS